MLNRLFNTTDLADDFVELAMLHLTPKGLAHYDLRVRNSKKHAAAGKAFVTGRTPFRDNGRPLVLIKLGAHSRFPFTITKFKGNRYHVTPVRFANKEEAFIYIAAHEIRHCWQWQFPYAPRAPGSRGKLSEVDANVHALRKLNEFRAQLSNENSLLEQDGAF